MDALVHIAEQFLSGAILEVTPLSGGHIHRTYLVKEAAEDGLRTLVLQRFNHLVFRDPVGVMNNMLKVSQQIMPQLKTDSEFNVFQIVPDHSGAYLFEDHEHYFWRMLSFIDNSYSLDHVQYPKHAYAGALAFGTFLALISELKAEELIETIPNFHHLGHRYDYFKEACKLDKVNRLQEVSKEVDFVHQRAAFIKNIVELISGGTLPLRVVHNDTKISNVLFDRDTDRGISVVDWDTIMPGYLMYDFGDMVRTFTSPVQEDSQDLASVKVQLPVFQALCQGFFESIYKVITDSEINSLLPGAQLMTFIMGLRFLTDYLEGDVYYNVEYPTHNLDRCRNQFRLLESLESQSIQLQQIVRESLAKYTDP